MPLDLTALRSLDPTARVDALIDRIGGNDAERGDRIREAQALAVELNVANNERLLTLFESGAASATVRLLKSYGAAPDPAVHVARGEEHRLGPFATRAKAVQMSVPGKRQVELHSEMESLTIYDRFKARYLVCGHGAKAQFADLELVQKQLSAIKAYLDGLHGDGDWLAVFGGDPYKPEKPDVAFVTKSLSDKGVRMFAMQSDGVRDEMPVDRYVDYVYYCPTDRDEKGDIRWGGVSKSGEPVGPTRVYLGKVLGPRLDGILSFGGGAVAEQEKDLASRMGIRIFYAPAMAKFPQGNYPFGLIHRSMRASIPLEVGKIYAENASGMLDLIS
jgi:hypothetical protein